MLIKLIDYGLPEKRKPFRAHYNDCGADVYSPKAFTVYPQETIKIPLGFGLEIPDGFAGYIYPRSGLSLHGIVCELPPIDASYRGEIHAIISNLSKIPYVINEGDRIGQLVIMPVILADFTKNPQVSKRGVGAFGSTGV